MKKNDCIFCKLANGDIPATALYEDDMVKVIFDRGPATKGHALILPKEHFDNIYEIEEEYAKKIMVVASKVAKAMKESLGCDGINVLQNNEEAAGQTVFHFHTHIIPRYKGDGVSIGWKPNEVTDEQIEELAEKISICIK